MISVMVVLAKSMNERSTVLTDVDRPSLLIVVTSGISEDTYTWPSSTAMWERTLLESNDMDAKNRGTPAVEYMSTVYVESTYKVSRNTTASMTVSRETNDQRIPSPE
jgi:hypothetical protein